jgi:hypothetical protein
MNVRASEWNCTPGPRPLRRVAEIASKAHSWDHDVMAVSLGSQSTLRITGREGPQPPPCCGATLRSTFNFIGMIGVGGASEIMEAYPGYTSILQLDTRCMCFGQCWDANGLNLLFEATASQIHSLYP